MKPEGGGKWEGAIYNADDGKTYSAAPTLAANKIKLQACAALVFCKSNEFVRAR